MEIDYLKILLLLLSLTFFVIFFIFTTAVAVYLKIFIKKGLSYKEFIISKYTGGILNAQIKSIRSFYIFYDFFMLSVLSFGSYAIIAGMLFPILTGFENKPYQTIGLYLFSIFLFTIIISIDDIKGIARIKWSWPSAPQGAIIIWQEESKFGVIYNFIGKFFIYILLLLTIFFLIIFYFQER